MRRQPRTPSISGSTAILLTSLVCGVPTAWAVYDTFLKDSDQRDCQSARAFEPNAAYRGLIRNDMDELRCDFEDYVRKNPSASQEDLDHFIDRRSRLASSQGCSDSLETWMTVGQNVDYTVTSDFYCSY